MVFPTLTVNERIRAARYLRGMSQKGFAKQMRTDQAVVCRWESGKSNPLPATLLEIAKTLHVNMLWLTFGEGLMESPTSTSKDSVAAESSAS